MRKTRRRWYSTRAARLVAVVRRVAGNERGTTHAPELPVHRRWRPKPTSRDRRLRLERRATRRHAPEWIGPVRARSRTSRGFPPRFRVGHRPRALMALPRPEALGATVRRARRAQLR